MKTKSVIILGVVGMVAAVPAAAQTQPGFELGVEVFDYSYRERFEGNTIVFDDGLFLGLTASYAHGVGGNWFVRGRFSIAAGSVDYSSADGRIPDVPQDIGQLDLQVGHESNLTRGVTLTAFTGVGSRLLNDHSGGEQTASGLRGYDREIGYAYIPLGLSIGVPLGDGISMAVSGQYNHVLGGQATSFFSRVDSEAPDVELDLNGGSGLEISAILSVPVGGSKMRVGPFLRHWDIDRSDSLVLREDDLEVEIFEPGNKTTEAGVRLSFAF